MTQQTRNKANDKRAMSLQLKPRKANNNGYGKNFIIGDGGGVSTSERAAINLARKDVSSK